MYMGPRASACSR
ncbi:hypothetical protein E2C01_093733 [Portunus trituberculatus]|uniref:Uncharacterized protein n=1 Tax=Portunus trituberculatus TaxID=210409 RepID=A0A5B7JVM2_PORTR|nr:hypothetical protein [Portunus trituberculatus]